MSESDQSMDSGPVTVSVSRRVRQGLESRYEDWVRGVSASAATQPGHMGINVLRPSDATKGEYVLIYRFDSYEHAQAWEESEERRLWTEKLPELVEGDATRKKVTGMEFWFDLPSVPAAAKPSPHKMAVVATVVVYFMVLFLSTVLFPLIGEWAFWQKLLIVIPAQVCLMTYLIMPRITRWLRHWLFAV